MIVHFKNLLFNNAEVTFHVIKTIVLSMDNRQKR